MTYAEKLKTQEWIEFRSKFISWRKEYDLPAMCENCGKPDGKYLHVHHKRYTKGKEPWEYPFSDLSLLCRDCHDDIHELEHRLRNFALTVKVHECFEFHTLLDLLEEIQKENLLAVALARCRNVVRKLKFSAEDSNPLPIYSMEDLERMYAEKAKKGELE